jgi:hypothetical protein
MIFSPNSSEVADPMVLARVILGIIIIIVMGPRLTGKRRPLRASCFALWRSFIKVPEER